MASFHGIASVCEAIVYILNTSMTDEQRSLLNLGTQRLFSVYQSDDFVLTQNNNPLTSGASVFLYRALPNLSHRTPSGQRLPNGSQQFTRLPLDLHLLLTIWGNESSTQNLLLRWVMRTLEDYPIIPATILNAAATMNLSSTEAVFDDDEAVELLLGEMSGEELLQLWDTLGDGDGRYQISVPYLVRNLFIDSTRTRTLGEPVQIRTADMQVLER